MDAPLRLVSKYAQPYRSLFPSATIVIKLSDGQTYLQGDKARSLSRLAAVLHEEGEKQVNRERMRHEMGSVLRREREIRLDEDVKEELRQAEGEAVDEAQNRRNHDVGDSTVTLVDKSEAAADSNQEDQEQSSEAPGTADTKAEPAPSPIPSPPPTGILVHSFSDGGANNLAYILRFLTGASSLVPGATGPSPLTPRATIFDGSPSDGNAWSGATAFTLPLLKSRYWLVRVAFRRLARVCIWFYLRFLLGFWRAVVTRRESRNSIFRRALNDHKQWAFGADLAAGRSRQSHDTRLPPRMYLYSKADALVPSYAVEAHAKDAAEAQGRSVKVPIPVDMEGTQAAQEAAKEAPASGTEERVHLRRWTHAPHCAIARYDSPGYWREVRQFLVQNM